MKRRVYWIYGAAALALIGAGAGGTLGTLAIAQDAPESLLPPGFDDPAPAPAPSPAPASALSAAGSASENRGKGGGCPD